MAFSWKIKSKEIIHSLEFLRTMFDKGNSFFAMNNSAKRAIVTIIHIPSYDSLNKNSIVEKYFTGIFNIRLPKS